MTRSHSGMITALAGAFALSGCGSEPTGPGARIRIDASPAQLQATRVMIEDARIRLLVSLKQLAGTNALELAIDGLASAVDLNDPAAMEQNAFAALEALKQMRTAGGPAEEAELAAIDLTIMAAAEILEYPDGTRGNSNIKSK